MPDPQQVNLTDEELQAAVANGWLSAESPNLYKLDSDSRRRFVRFSLQAKDPNTPTLRDWWANPNLARQQTGDLIKGDLTNPRVLIPLGIGLAAGVGPRLVRSALRNPTVSAAAKAAAPALGKAALGYRGGQMIEAAQAARDAVREMPRPSAPPKASAPPPPVAAAPTPRSSAAPEAAAPSVPPTATAPIEAAAPKSNAPAPKASGAALPDEFPVTHEELQSAIRWQAKGVPIDQIIKRIEVSRELTGKLGLPTPDATREAILRRNATGKWE